MAWHEIVIRHGWFRSKAKDEMLRARSGRSQEADNSVLGEGVGVARLCISFLEYIKYNNRPKGPIR